MNATLETPKGTPVKWRDHVHVPEVTGKVERPAHFWNLLVVVCSCCNRRIWMKTEDVEVIEK